MPIVDAGIDYLRLTVRPSQSLNEVHDVWRSMMATAIAAGHEEKKWRFLDYNGVEAGGFYCGAREDGAVFEARGGVANIAFEHMKGRGFDGNIARLDAQASVSGQEEHDDQTETLFDALRLQGATRETKRRRNLILYRPAKGADSFYVGSRNSSAYLCVYDALAVHPERFTEPTRRYECRYSNESARERYETFQACGSVTCTAASLVIGHCLSVGLQREWFKAEPPISPMKQYKPTSDEKSMDWLERYVKKTLLRLIANGRGPELAARLGLKALEIRDV
jgi:hypothetical protein